MKIGPGIPDFDRRFVAAEETRSMVREFMGALNPVSMPCDSTAQVFTTPQGGRIGFIASESEPFCGDCSRLRLSATGTLRPCLMVDAGISLRHARLEDYPELVSRVVAEKPEGRLAEMTQGMYQVGG
jgi:cyclic pyranopterin phosphate synthase